MTREDALSDRDSDSILQLTDIRKQYGDIVAVDGQSLNLAPGEFFTLLGPSGSGKSTLLRIIAGLEPPTSGTVQLSGDDVTDDPAYERDTALIFQDFALFPHMTVGENITFPLKMRDVPPDERERRGKEVLSFTDMDGYYDRYPDQLSGGEQQRVALARGLIAEPDILLLDEPLASLDRKLRQQLEIELRKFQRQTDITFVYVTHNQEEALTMSDRIGVMNDGEIKQVGTPEDVYTNPATPFVARFLGEANVFTGDVVDVNGDVATVDVAGERLSATMGEALDPGEVAQLVVKEEDFRLETTADENQLDGHVDDIIFEGNSRVYIVTPDGDGTPDEVTVHTSKHQSRDMDLAVDDRITLSWDPDDARVFAED
ncbi:MAG: ABC transporter ATP-binding protein [Haloferacaceae archaeon]